jgi:hypothetical protein
MASTPDAAKPKRHAVFPAAVPPELIQRCMEEFIPRFKPMKVAYSNTNAYIKEAARDAAQLESLAEATEQLAKGQQIAWLASSYMEVDESMGGAMQKEVQPDLELLATCQPIITACDDVFKAWYRSLHGPHSITDFKRLQTFVTRYRPRMHEDGLLRHIDGAQVDGSLVMGACSLSGMRRVKRVRVDSLGSRCNSLVCAVRQRHSGFRTLAVCTNEQACRVSSLAAD